MNTHEIVIYITEKKDNGQIWPICTIANPQGETPVITGKINAVQAHAYLHAATKRIRAQAALNLRRAGAEDLALLTPDIQAEGGGEG